MAFPAPLTIDANLSLFAADGTVVTVTATDSVIDVTLPSLWSRQRAMGPMADRSQRQSLLVQLQRALAFSDLTLRIKVRQHVVAQLRPLSKPTFVSRMLGLGAFEVRIIAGLRALLGRASAA